MKIAVIAANGRSGKEFVRIALQHGHHLRAGVYRDNSLKSNQNLDVIECDATNIDQIKKLIKDQDAVISFIGHVKNSPADVQSRSIKNIIDAMDAMKIKRLISLTGTGVRFPGDKIRLVDRILNFAVSVVDPYRIKDGINHAEIIKSSNLEWTIIRVLKLQNIKPKKFVLRPGGPTKLMVSRTDVAFAALEIIEKNSFIRQAPIISK